MSEMWLVSAHMEEISLAMEHWKGPVWAPQIITPHSKVGMVDGWT